MALRNFLPLLLLVLGGSSAQFNEECSRAEYERCVRIADPLVKEAHLVFPDNMRDIEMVCRTWNKFVDCVRRYTDKCFDDQQRRQFNKAVENPIESVHQMCSQPYYQSEYLRYAPCIKSTITEASHCGPQYSLLVEQVEQGGAISKATLCCSHDKFKECVQKETRRLCDRGQANGPAASFSNQIMEKALSFLREQCINYIPNSGDCGSETTDALLSPISSEVYPWSSTLQEPQAAKEMPSSQSWLPSGSTLSHQQANSGAESAILGSRTRPASYGRASSWSDASFTPQNTLPGFSTVREEASTPSTRFSWATTGGAGWSSSPSSQEGIYNTQPLSESTAAQDHTAWYPAAGTSNGNEVDEPNQQGLAKPKNDAAEAAGGRILSLTVIATVLTTFC